MVRIAVQVADMLVQLLDESALRMVHVTVEQEPGVVPGASTGLYGNYQCSRQTGCSIAALMPAPVPRSLLGWSPCYSRLCEALRGRSGSPRERTGSDLGQVRSWPLLLRRVRWYVLSAPTQAGWLCGHGHLL